MPVDERRREPADEARAATTSPGATTPTTPVGSGIVKLKYGAATGLDEPRTWPILSAQPAYQTQRSMARSTTSRAARRREPLGGLDLGGELLAPALHQLRDAVEDLAAVHRGLGRPSRGTPCARPGRRRGGPCATRGRRWRAASPSAADTRYERPDLGPRERAADVQLVGLADVDPAGSPRAPSAVLQPDVGVEPVHPALAPEARIPCSRRTARSGRTG